MFGKGRSMMGIIGEYFTIQKMIEAHIKNSYRFMDDDGRYISTKKIIQMRSNDFEDFFLDRLPRYNHVSPQPILHRHNYIEFIYVYSGKLVQIINKERKIYYKGDVCILDYNTLHAEINERGEDDIIIFFGMSKKFFNKRLFNKNIFNFN